MPIVDETSSSTTSNNEVVKVEGNSAQEFSTDLLRLYYGNVVCSLLRPHLTLVL
jgi:hypothetical protein